MEISAHLGNFCVVFHFPWAHPEQKPASLSCCPQPPHLRGCHGTQGSRWYQQCPRARNEPSQSSRELSTGALLLIHIQVLAHQEPRVFPTKAAFLSPDYKWLSVQDFFSISGATSGIKPRINSGEGALLPQNADWTLNHALEQLSLCSTPETTTIPKALFVQS